MNDTIRPATALVDFLTPIARHQKHQNKILTLLLLESFVGTGCSKQGPSKDQLLARAKEALESGQLLRAEKDYRDVLRVAPEDPTALSQLAILYSEQGQFLQAFPLLKKSAELNPDDTYVQTRLGLALLAIGDIKKARDTVLPALSKTPENDDALILLAATASSPDEANETRKLIDSFRQQGRDWPGYHVALGTLHLRLQEVSRAESEFKLAIKLDANSSNAHAAL